MHEMEKASTTTTEPDVGEAGEGDAGEGDNEADGVTEAVKTDDPVRSLVMAGPWGGMGMCWTEEAPPQPQNAVCQGWIPLKFMISWIPTPGHTHTHI